MPFGKYQKPKKPEEKNRKPVSVLRPKKPRFSVSVNRYQKPYRQREKRLLCKSPPMRIPLHKLIVDVKVIYYEENDADIATDTKDFSSRMCVTKKY